MKVKEGNPRRSCASVLYGGMRVNGEAFRTVSVPKNLFSYVPVYAPGISNKIQVSLGLSRNTIIVLNQRIENNVKDRNVEIVFKTFPRRTERNRFEDRGISLSPLEFDRLWSMQTRIIPILKHLIGSDGYVKYCEVVSSPGNMLASSELHQVLILSDMNTRGQKRKGETVQTPILLKLLKTVSVFF